MKASRRLKRVALRLPPDTCRALRAAVLRCAGDPAPVHQRPLSRSPLQMGLKRTAPREPRDQQVRVARPRHTQWTPMSSCRCCHIRRETCALRTSVSALKRKRPVRGQAPKGVMINASTAAPEQLLLTIRRPPPLDCPGGCAACPGGCAACSGGSLPRRVHRVCGGKKEWRRAGRAGHAKRAPRRWLCRAEEAFHRAGWGVPVCNEQSVLSNRACCGKKEWRRAARAGHTNREPRRWLCRAEQAFHRAWCGVPECNQRKHASRCSICPRKWSG